MYSILADVVVCLHFAFIFFVVVGAFIYYFWGHCPYLHIPAVFWGFWKDVESDEGSARFQSLGGSAGGMREFEIRFYASHEDAVNHGIKYADDATGQNAVLTKQESLWPEGIRNRRTSGGPDGSPLPKFGDYVIFGNLIVFCEGMSSEEAIQNCSIFLKNLE